MQTRQSWTADSAPGVATWEATLSAPKSSPVRPLACNWYYCAQFIAKPKVACALFLAATFLQIKISSYSSNPGGS